jgi:hypothetical protein
MPHSFDIANPASKEETPENIRAALTMLEERCKSAKIDFTDESDPGLLDVEVKVAIPCGRNTREISLTFLDDLIDFLKIRFEDYSFIGKFSAIVSYQTGVIEAPLSMPNALQRTKNQFVNRLLTDRSSRGTPIRRRERIISAPTEDNPMTISIMRTSPTAEMICQPSGDLNLSLTIKNSEITTQEAALNLLQEVANSLFFSLDVQSGLYVSLIREESRSRRQAPLRENVDIVFSRRDHDRAPMELYWYARSATNMPLLQFLAYYQVVEYYYSTFSNFDITRRLQSIIKHPAFRVENDSDIERIISTVKTRGGNNSSEKEQLKATLRECLDDSALPSFFTENSERGAFFATKNKGITSKSINLQNKNVELYAQVAERIYDIRCKIVHIKGDDNDGEVELLLPYSTEAEKLSYDIELMRFLAQQVMIYCSR